MTLLILISILCISALPVVSAAETGSHGPIVSHATPEQIKLINELWGSDISIGEYMQKVHPEHLVDVPDAAKKDMFQRKMIWPDGKVNRIASLSKLTTSLTVTGYISKISSNRIDFGGKSQLSPPSATAGYIYVEAFLKNSAGTTVDSTSASDRGVNSVDTGYKMYFWPANGVYHVESYGYTTTPRLEGTASSGTVTIP